MKALKIVGYIISMLLVATIIVVWLAIFPFSGENADRFGFAIGVVVYFAIFIIASAVPFLIGVVGIILAGVKRKGKEIVNFIVIALLPAVMSFLMLLSTQLL